MESKTGTPSRWITRCRVVVLTGCAGLVVVSAWLLMERVDSLRERVEAIGGKYSESNLDFFPGGGQSLWNRVANTVINRMAGVDRRFVEISFDNTAVTDDWVRRNAEGLQQRRAHVLRFRNTGITDDAVTALTGMKSLVSLDLSGTSVTDQSMATIRSFTSLQWIYLTETDVTDVGITELAGHPMLVHIDLDGDVLTDEAVSLLNAMPRLRSLGLRHVSNEQLSRLAGLKTVHSLSLTGTTDEALPVLLQLRQFKSLILFDSELSPASIEAVRAASAVTVTEYRSLESAEGLGITEEVLETQRRFVVLSRLALLLSVGSLLLFAVWIWRRRYSRRVTL